MNDAKHKFREWLTVIYPHTLWNPAIKDEIAENADALFSQESRRLGACEQALVRIGEILGPEVHRVCERVLPNESGEHGLFVSRSNLGELKRILEGPP